MPHSSRSTTCRVFQLPLPLLATLSLLLGFIVVTGNSLLPGLQSTALAAEVLPGAPAVQRLVIPSHPEAAVTVQASPTPADAAFVGSIPKYDLWLTLDPNIPASAWYFGPAGPEGQFYIGMDVYVQPGRNMWAMATMTTTSGYTTPRSAPVIIYGKDYVPGGGTTPPPTTPPVTTPPVTPPPTTGTTCPSIQVFTIRGSRASVSDNSDADGVTNAFQARFKEKVEGSRFTAVHYDAIPVGYGLQNYGVKYADSMSSGVRELNRLIDEFIATCPGKPYGIIGYSQGAHALGEVIESLSPIAASQLKWSVTFGNPARNLKQKKLEAVPNSGTHNGIISALPGGKELLLLVPPERTGKYRSYCIANDPVCDYTFNQLGKCKLKAEKCPHIMYKQDGWVRDGANWAIVQTRR